MATEKPPTAGEVLANLEQQLTCPVCLDRYTQPRTLPCLHSFCHGCLGRFPVEFRKNKHFITCPVCRQTMQQPDKGVSGFQSAFLINNLLELHQVLEKVSGSKQNMCENCYKENAFGYCKQCSKFICMACVDMHNKWGDFTSHQILRMDDVAITASKLVPLKERLPMECSSHGEPLKVYCDTCNKLLCHLCTAGKVHRNHDYEPITDSFQRHRLQIKNNLQKVSQKLSTFNTAVRAVENHQEGFLKQVGEVRREIEATVQQLMHLLHESERQLMRELDQVTDAYIEKISAHKVEVDNTIAQLKSCKEYVEEELRIGSQQEILVMKQQMVKRMAAVCSLDNLQPLEETRVRFLKNASVLEACHSLGSVVRYGQFKTAGGKMRFDLCSAAPLSSEQVSCQLSPVADPTIIFKCVVHQVTPGSFEVHFSSPIAGLHQLRVQVVGADIPDPPGNVEIMPRKEGHRYDLADPRGLAITRVGHLIVAENGKDHITIIDSANVRKIRSFGQHCYRQAQFNRPQGVAVTQDGRIIVTEYCNHCLLVLTVEGAFIAKVGARGSQPLQFQYPTSVAVHDNGYVYVSDSDNHRVQVLNADLTYSHCFGNKGSQPGELKFPRGITIDADGMVYVADYRNNRVQKFTPEGKLLAIIDSKKGDRLNCPYGLHADCYGILYVTEYFNNTVSMFTSNGKFLGYIGDSDGSSFDKPKYIVSDKANRLYISDNNVVVVYMY